MASSKPDFEEYAHLHLLLCIFFLGNGFQMQVESISSHTKSAAQICCCHLEEISDYEIPFECIYGP